MAPLEEVNEFHEEKQAFFFLLKLRLSILERTFT